MPLCSRLFEPPPQPQINPTPNLFRFVHAVAFFDLKKPFALLLFDPEIDPYL